MNNNCSTENKPRKFNELIRSWYFWKPFLGVLLGALAGFLYYYFVGCKSGSCPITGNPWASMLWGAIIGLFITNSPCKSC